jgi:opacity protein-like surface antigen
MRQHLQIVAMSLLTIAAPAAAGSAARAQGASFAGALADCDSAAPHPAPAATDRLPTSTTATPPGTGTPRAAGYAAPAHVAGFRPRIVWTFKCGSYDAPEREGQLVHANYPLTSAAACGYRVSPNFEVGGELTGFIVGYEGPPVPAPPNRSVSDQRPLSNWGLGATVRGFYPFRWFQPYAEMGVACSSTTISADVSEYVGFWPFVFSKKVDTREETVSGLAPHLSLGVDLAVSKYASIGAEYRRMWLKGDFGRLSNGEVVVAESFYSFVFRTTRLGGGLLWPF